jgi:hypothetical protein
MNTFLGPPEFEAIWSPLTSVTVYMLTRNDTLFLDYLNSAFNTAAETSNLTKANFRTALFYTPVFILAA